MEDIRELETVRLKAEAAARIEAERQRIIAISHTLHANPEIAWQEYRSAALLSTALKDIGFNVEKGAAGLPTALNASLGTGDHVVAVIAEYDALPGLGHACGHNVIAASAYGVAIALAPLVDKLGLTLRIIGTPAEEGGGGKIIMLERGIFDDVDLAMMIHPGPSDSVYTRARAVAHFDVEYTGRESHAAAYPHLGVNAADAFSIAQIAIGLLRQHLPDEARVHGIVREAGTAPNAIPANAVGSWYVRAADSEQLDQLFPRIQACFEAGALATGCLVRITETSGRYSEFHNDEQLVASFAANAEALGRHMDGEEGIREGITTASTDMGNVSRAVRAIHPFLSIDSLPAVNHQRGFTAAAANPPADQTVIDGAILMAQTIIDDALNCPTTRPAQGKGDPVAGR